MERDNIVLFGMVTKYTDIAIPNARAVYNGAVQCEIRSQNDIYPILLHKNGLLVLLSRVD